MATAKWNFKQGDRVRCINSAWSDGLVRFGDVYTVECYNPNGYLMKLEDMNFWFPSYNFEPEILHVLQNPDQLELFPREDLREKTMRHEGRDPVNHPDHYTMGKIEVYDFIKAWDMGFAEGNVVKYVVRAPYKGRAVEDLKKARWYLDQLIKKAEDDHG